MNKNKIFSLFVILLLFSCINKKQSNNVDNLKRFNEAKKQKLMIIGKQLKSLERIVGDSIDLKNKAIFIYNGFDCEDCIDIGYKLTKKIDSLSNIQVVYIIATSTNIGRDQYRNTYYKFIYFDEHDLIRRELKYIYTPVIIKLDSLNIIEDAFFPNPNRNMKDELIFLKKCIIN
ncbi:MAG: hypothetical protein CSA36_00490 [Draconibacterium sp.]|nr:MAG: hypothetical protein CSA36_00490 [Draconibacterium sp.]